MYLLFFLYNFCFRIRLIRIFEERIRDHEEELISTIGIKNKVYDLFYVRFYWLRLIKNYVFEKLQNSSKKNYNKSNQL